jgi:hypothetical protein
MQGAIIGAVVGAAAVLLIALVQPRRHCPACKRPLPRFRAPKGLREHVLGGWTCQCGCKVDRRGRKIGA